MENRVNQEIEKTGILVRPALLEDMQEIEAIWKELMDLHGEIQDYYTLSPEGHRIWASVSARYLNRNDAIIFVADAGGIVAGFAVAHISQLPAFYKLKRLGVISDIAIKDGFRRRGMGSALVEACLVWFRERGMDRVTANMVPANPQALGFWKAMKFDVLSEYRIRSLTDT